MAEAEPLSTVDTDDAPSEENAEGAVTVETAVSDDLEIIEADDEADAEAEEAAEDDEAAEEAEEAEDGADTVTEADAEAVTEAEDNGQNGTADLDLTIEPPHLTDLDDTLYEVVRFDRSQSRVRLPTAMVSETLRIANNLSFAEMSLDRIERLDHHVVGVLKRQGLLVDGRFDPMVERLLAVINQASLMITLDLHFGPDSSHRTIWATPRDAAVSNEVDDEVIELRPTDVSQLPFVLHQMMLARSPRYVGAAPISISTEAVASAEQLRAEGDLEAATNTLTEAGLSAEQARIVLSFQADRVRRWRIASAWSTDGGQESRELRGIDADAEGHWLVAMTGARENDRGQITFTPQGHGDVMRSLRGILPRVWFGRPLAPPAV